jgi:hypothetical protein
MHKITLNYLRDKELAGELPQPLILYVESFPFINTPEPRKATGGQSLKAASRYLCITNTLAIGSACQFVAKSTSPVYLVRRNRPQLYDSVSDMRYLDRL